VAVVESSFYRVLDESGPGGSAVFGVYRSGEHTRGPWDRGHQHAGPPSALLARAVERLGHAPAPGLLARTTVEILSPIPVGDLRVEAHVVREGSRVALCEAALYAVTRPDVSPHASDPDPGTPVARMTGWRIRTTPAALDLPSADDDPAPPTEGHAMTVPATWSGGYLQAIEWTWVHGDFGEPGPATVWTRLRHRLVDVEEPSAVQRVLVVADSGNGISAVADPRSAIFVNTELTVHLHRAPVGEQVWMSARTVLDRHGVGLATSRLGDPSGGIGVGAQTLFVAPR